MGKSSWRTTKDEPWWFSKRESKTILAFKIIMKNIHIILCLFLSACNIETNKSNTKNQEKLNIYVLSPDINIVADGIINPLKLKNNNTFNISSINKYFISDYLESIGINDLKSCSNSTNINFPQLLIDHEQRGKVLSYISDGEILATIDMKYCKKVSRDIIENFILVDRFKDFRE